MHTQNQALNPKQRVAFPFWGGECWRHLQPTEDLIHASVKRSEKGEPALFLAHAAFSDEPVRKFWRTQAETPETAGGQCAHETAAVDKAVLPRLAAALRGSCYH